MMWPKGKFESLYHHTSLPCISVSVKNTKLARSALKPDVSLLCTENLCRSSKKARRNWEKEDPKTYAEVTRTSTLYVSEQRIGRTIIYGHLIGRWWPLVSKAKTIIPHVRACFVFSLLLWILQSIFGGINSTRLYLYEEESNIISECHLNAIAGIIFANRNILLKELLLIIPLKNMQQRFLVFQN